MHQSDSPTYNLIESHHKSDSIRFFPNNDYLRNFTHIFIKYPWDITPQIGLHLILPNHI